MDRGNHNWRVLQPHVDLVMFGSFQQLVMLHGNLLIVQDGVSVWVCASVFVFECDLPLILTAEHCR